MLRLLMMTFLATASVMTVDAQEPPAKAQDPAASTKGQVRMPPELQQVKPAGEEKRVRADDIDKLLAGGKVVLLDVREPWELEEYGTRPGYINIPIAELEQRLDELPKDKAILTA